MYLLYSALLGLALALGSPYWLFEMLRHGKYRRGLRERFGAVPDRLPRGARTIWVHAVSVGEVLAVSRVVSDLNATFPDYNVVVSTTTDTGQKLAASRFGAENVFYFPFDFEFCLKPYFLAFQPQLVVVAETEFWPNFLRLAREFGTKVAIVNARISDRSFPGYLRWRGLLKRVLNSVDVFLAQTPEDARRLVEIGAPQDRVLVGGNLKFDVPTPDEPAIVGQIRSSLAESVGGPVLVCGSTMDEEELLLLGAFKNVLASHPAAVMLLAPRKPERFGEVAALLAQLNVKFWRRSLWDGGPLNGGVLLIDSIGELASLYSLADIAFVGGSLVPRGGHSIIEPAQHEVAIVVGNHTENFRDIVSLFQSRNAVRVLGPAELPLALMELLANEDERRSLAQNAREALDSQRGATQRTLEKLSSLLTSPAQERTAEMDFPTWIYATWMHARNDCYDHRILRSRALTRPVISVGNLSVGGSGKTPFVILLGELLKQRGIPFDVLSRGYGRESRGVLAVNPEGSALDFGDEPILIAKRLRCPVVVGESRYEAGLFAEKNFSAQVHILDDGFQHRFLVRDLEIVLLTSEDLVDRLLPAGRLREPISALDRAHVVVLPEEMSMSPSPGKTIWRIRRKIGIPQVPARPVAFCGIAKPNRFIEQLRQAGVEIAAQRFYRDHHAYTADDVRDLLALREEKNAGGFVTTEKDAINLGLHYGQLTPLTVAHVRMELLNPADALDTLLRVIAEHQSPA